MRQRQQLAAIFIPACPSHLPCLAQLSTHLEHDLRIVQVALAKPDLLSRRQQQWWAGQQTFCRKSTLRCLGSQQASSLLYECMHGKQKAHRCPPRLTLSSSSVRSSRSHS